MKKHFVKVLKTSFLTHDVKSIVVERPPGYSFVAGQATEVALNVPGFSNEYKPFTITSLATENTLEFIIKIYRDRNGVTKQIELEMAGNEWILSEVFGSIQYKGPGIFLAGGTGITPFISIFRELSHQKILHDNTLLYANKTETDIICKDELQELLGDKAVNILETDKTENGEKRVLSAADIIPYVNTNDAVFYICGSERFVEHCCKLLSDMGISKNRIVMEE